MAGRGRRNPGAIVHDLQWSQAFDRPVQCVMADRKTKTGKVVRTVIDRGRERELMRLTPAERKASTRSTMVAVFEDGSELAVDSIAKVKRPVGDEGGAFAGPA